MWRRDSPPTTRHIPYSIHPFPVANNTRIRIVDVPEDVLCSVEKGRRIEEPLIQGRFQKVRSISRQTESYTTDQW